MRTPTGPHPMSCADSPQSRVPIGLACCGPSEGWKLGFDTVRSLLSVLAWMPISLQRSWLNTRASFMSQVLKTCLTQSMQSSPCKPSVRTSEAACVQLGTPSARGSCGSPKGTEHLCPFGSFRPSVAQPFGRPISVLLSIGFGGFLSTCFCAFALTGYSVPKNSSICGRRMFVFRPLMSPRRSSSSGKPRPRPPWGPSNT